MSNVTRTIEYRRANWFVHSEPLEILLRRAWKKQKTQVERTVRHYDGADLVGLNCKKYGGGGIAIHCAKYVDQQAVGTIPMNPKAEATLGERSPRQGENFLNSDLMAVIRGNNVVTLNAGINAALLRVYLQGLFRASKLDEDSTGFNLTRVANLDRIAMIEASGVAKIDLKLGLSEAAAMDISEMANGKGFWSKVTSGIAEPVQAIIAQDDNLNQLSKTEKGTVLLSINVPKGDLEVAKMGLNYLAAAVVDEKDADNFIIHLRNGQTIKPSEIAVRKRVDLDPVANSVSVEGAWKELNNYMNELTENGQIEA